MNWRVFFLLSSMLLCSFGYASESIICRFDKGKNAYVLPSEIEIRNRLMAVCEHSQDNYWFDPLPSLRMTVSGVEVHSVGDCYTRYTSLNVAATVEFFLLFSWAVALDTVLSCHP